MDIELLTQGKFMTSGSSVLNLIQNKSMPILDLIVRESIQNSLDAAKKDAKYVNVEYIHDDFDVVKLSNYFSSIKDMLLKHNKENTFLAIEDKNTVGLTGTLDGKYSKNDTNQNLTKLVYHIMKSQTQEGAGGSWGIGKTVYYRVGLGLTIYYSRVLLSDGLYQDRLVAALVEDETKDDGLLSKLEDNAGVAFFGKNIEGTNDIEAITDLSIIKDILSTFNLKPYEGTDTGTVIIIPFIDPEKALMNNQVDGGSWWYASIEKYLKIAVLRWYFPRMAQEYNYGPKLKVKINNKIVEPDEINTKLFYKLTQLYNACYSDEYEEWINKEIVERKRDVQDNNIGTFVYGVIPKSYFPIKPNMYKFVLMDESEEQRNALICYVRKPGMIVNYKLENIKSKDADSYIIGIFVLNSRNYITSPINMNLDEYIRLSEKADHSSWEDHSLKENASKLLIVKNIFGSISNILDNEYSEHADISGDSEMYMDIAKKFGKLLMPDEGFSFGTIGSSRVPKRNGGRGKKKVIASHSKYKVTMEGQQFSANEMNITYHLTVLDHIDELSLVHKIVTANGWYDVTDEDYKDICKCEIIKVGVLCTKCNSKAVNYVNVINKDKCTSTDLYSLEPKIIDGKFSKLNIKFNPGVSKIDMELKVAIQIQDPLIQTGIAFE